MSPCAPRRGRSAAAPWARGLSAALAIGAAGSLATPPVWVLALAGGIAFADLGRRERAEPGGAGPDWSAWALQLAFLAILCAAAWQNADPGRAPRWPGLPELFGALVIGAGLALRRRAERAMGPLFTVRLRVDADHVLVDWGPFARIRHPSYASLLLIAGGTALACRSSLALLATLALWLPAALVRIRLEEAALAERFGPAYEAYARRTWRLVPWLF